MREVVQVKSPTFNSRSEQVGALGGWGGGCVAMRMLPQQLLSSSASAVPDVQSRAPCEGRTNPGWGDGGGAGGGGGSKLLLVVVSKR